MKRLAIILILAMIPFAFGCSDDGETTTPEKDGGSVTDDTGTTNDDQGVTQDDTGTANDDIGAQGDRSIITNPDLGITVPDMGGGGTLSCSEVYTETTTNCTTADINCVPTQMAKACASAAPLASDLATCVLSACIAECGNGFNAACKACIAEPNANGGCATELTACQAHTSC